MYVLPKPLKFYIRYKFISPWIEQKQLGYLLRSVIQKVKLLADNSSEIGKRKVMINYRSDALLNISNTPVYPPSPLLYHIR